MRLRLRPRPTSIGSSCTTYYLGNMRSFFIFRADLELAQRSCRTGPLSNSRSKAADSNVLFRKELGALRDSNCLEQDSSVEHRLTLSENPLRLSGEFYNIWSYGKNAALLGSLSNSNCTELAFRRNKVAKPRRTLSKNSCGCSQEFCIKKFPTTKFPTTIIHKP